MRLMFWQARYTFWSGRNNFWSGRYTFSSAKYRNKICKFFGQDILTAPMYTNVYVLLRIFWPEWVPECILPTQPGIIFALRRNFYPETIPHF